VLWRSSLTISGPATIRVSFLEGDLRVDAWGPGADILAATAPSLAGFDDRPVEVVAVHRAVADACRRHWRTPLPASRDPYHELIPAVLGQRVTAAEAATQWGRLCRSFGGLAPGPDVGLYLPPDPAHLAEVAYSDFHRFGIERKRAETLIGIARRAHKLLPGTAGDRFDSTASLELLDGVGPWTSAVAGAVAFGDADAVPVGDFHLKNVVSTALAGRDRGTDSEMLDLLEPYSGQRGRVLWWLALDRWRAPMRGPRRRNLSVADL